VALILRMYTEFVLFSLPVRKPKMSAEFLSAMGIDVSDTMDCDNEEEDREDPDFLVVEFYRDISSPKFFSNLKLCKLSPVYI
jgi:hypothetical protein